MSFAEEDEIRSKNQQALIDKLTGQNSGKGLTLETDNEVLDKVLSSFLTNKNNRILVSLKIIKKDMYGGEAETTNNRMELMAAINGLEALTRPCKVNLYTDSKYVLDGITSWLDNWKKRGWKTANKKPVKNVELWQRLDAATNDHDINWIWVKGHSGEEGNELADELANRAIDELLAG